MESSKLNNNVYKHGKIYKIVDVGCNEQYFGSTAVGLSKRMTRYRHRYRQYTKRGVSFHTHHFFYLINMELKIVK